MMERRVDERSIPEDALYQARQELSKAKQGSRRSEEELPFRRTRSMKGEHAL